ncbi:Transcriptional regulatory protein ciaR [Sulfurovum sp. enrichment culture clone C5]|uniref:Transcriptional regulatory protein ciaR n=1 Tax=Sulfurovum sp. enrichment culture clone C5 TaxID=497650 RepID=A0A0S4XPH2_9BACT|nr:Transcriptional regulatory protein ciaR [Sulfurovum sp. enrichment culture clone C5]
MNKTKKVKIFLLEDDSNLNDTIVDFLESNNYAVDSAFDGEEAADLLYENSYDLLLLDVNVPKMNGFQLLKDARENGIKAPAVFITSLNSVDDLEEGFESGCDDYIRKPFELKELLIRVETLLKREFFHENKKFIEITEHIQYDIKNNELVVDERHINLGNKEARLLKLFMQHIGEIVSHEVIFQNLWDYDEEPSDTSLRTYIKNLRKVIGKDCIESVKKQGYKFITC